MVFEKARAKINLTLDVFGKRSDGYHEVEMVMQTVDFCDYLSIGSRMDGRIEVRSNAPFIPLDERNLAFQAADHLRRACGVSYGVSLDIDKRIPVAAGLAGGSTDAAAVLRGLNKLWNLGLSIPELAEIGAQIGSDVPFCVYGGTAIARGRGERIQPLEVAPCFWVILVKPPIAVSTADVYGALQWHDVHRHPDTQAMVQALECGDITQVSHQAVNVLEHVTLTMYPEVSRIKNQLEKLGAQVVLMSGSGPTVFALVERERRAKRIYNEMRSLVKETFLCRTY